MFLFYQQSNIRTSPDGGYLPAERLERDGIILKSSLTPTDMMVLKSDFQKYSPEAADAILSLSTPLPLIGVGAPIHVFLPRVAQLLHAKAIVPKYAGVANALGAAASRKVTHSSLTVKAEYEGGSCKGYSVFEDGQKYLFEEPEDAVAFGKEVLTRTVKKRALLQGLGDHPQIELSTEENRIGHTSAGLLLEIYIRATAF